MSILPLQPFFLILELRIPLFQTFFVKMHSVSMLAMKEPLLVNSPGGTMQTTNRCLLVGMVLRGVEFKITPIVLRTSGIDVILGMD
jgi:hypothetical protein